MVTLIEHILKLTGHRDRDLLDLTLAKALIALLPIQRVVIAYVLSGEGGKRWIEAVRLDAGGGGRVATPVFDFQALPRFEDAGDRVRCLQNRQTMEIAWAGELGPRITLFPLVSDLYNDEEGVIEIHSAAALSEEATQTIDVLSRIYRNMYRLLQYSDRDALTGLLNRNSLEDAFYSAVLEELGEGSGTTEKGDGIEHERRHQVPPNYWIGKVSIDNFHLIRDERGHLIAEDVVLLVARILNSTFRNHDRLYRFGGEQFVVLFHCPDESVALAALERFRSNMERFHFPQLGRVTASSGFTNILVDDSPGTTLERCDRAIEFAQKEGGNQVCSHLELVRRGLLGESGRTEEVDFL